MDYDKTIRSFASSNTSILSRWRDYVIEAFDAPIVKFVMASHFKSPKSLLFKTFSGIISKVPLNDIITLAWFLFLVSLPWLGFHFFWTVCAVLGLAMAGKELLKEPTPKDIFNNIHPLALGGGFPCVESSFSGVVCFYMSCAFSTLEIRVAVLLLTLLIGCTRIFALSHFPHQVVMGWLLGGAGVIISYIIQGGDFVYKDSGRLHWSALGIGFFLLVAVMGLRAENQTSAALRIPKHEYIRVMGNILREPAENVDEEEDWEVIPEDEREIDIDYAKMSELSQEEIKMVTASGYVSSGDSEDDEDEESERDTDTEDETEDEDEKEVTKKFPLPQPAVPLHPSLSYRGNNNNNNNKNQKRAKPDSLMKLMQTMEKRGMKDSNQSLSAI